MGRRSNPDHAWTDAMVARLKTLFTDNYSQRRIADVLNREFATKLTLSAVTGKIHRLELRNKTIKDGQIFASHPATPAPPLAQEIGNAEVLPSPSQGSKPNLAASVVPTREEAALFSLPTPKDVHCAWSSPCSDPRVRRSVYCQEHHRIVYPPRVKG